jgi:L-ribulose-5-phosphate 4-epimerase
MTTTELREAVYEANMALEASGLVFRTFGNVSGADHDAGLVAIKPSGIPYAHLSAANMVLVSLDTGAVVDSDLRPSSDTPTHLEIYRAFKCGGVAHTHSESATALAQARLAVRCMGTTHADYFHGDVSVTRALSAKEVAKDYERNTGLVIVETFRMASIPPEEVPGVLVANHGPFTWGADAAEAVERARVLEWLARMEIIGRSIAPNAARPAKYLVDRHYSRKHGPSAYYGQSDFDTGKR